MATRESIDVAIGDRAHQIMWRRRMTANGLGKALGISGATLGRKLRGSIAWSAADVLLVADVLDVDPADLLPRLDSNQEPSGFTSPQVSGTVIDARSRFDSHYRKDAA